MRFQARQPGGHQVTARHLLVMVMAVLVLAARTPAQEAGKNVSLDAYAEWRHGDALVIDGQQVRADAATNFKGRHAASFDDIELGDEVRVKGVRQANGGVLAKEVEAKPNGDALFEDDVIAVTDEVEGLWVEAGEMFEPNEDETEVEVIGELVERGREVTRVRRIIDDLLPPYVSAEDVRVYVVDTKEWNAAAMGNGAIWVYTGLIKAMSDDELAIVLGHELAHYTHEHSRRGAKSGMWLQLFGMGVAAAADAIENDVLRSTAQVAALATMSAALSKYSRTYEDQADRVGLRYVHEAGYDVTKGPGLWARFREKYGDGNKLVTFFLGSHSRPTDRIRNIEREISLNYR